MKKTFYYFLTAFLCVLSITSCEKDEEDPYSNNGVGAFTSVLINGKGISNGESLALSGKDPLSLTWEATRGLENIKSIKITCNGKPVRDYTGILWDGIAKESLPQGGEVEKWIKNIKLLPINGTYALTLTNNAGQTTTFTFKVQGSIIIAGAPTLEIKINGSSIANNTGKSVPEGSLFTLSWVAIKGDSLLKDIKIEFNGYEIGLSPYEPKNDDEKDYWAQSVTLPLQAGSYKVTLTDVDGLTQIINFSLLVGSDPIPSSLLGRWKYSYAVTKTNYPEGIAGPSAAEWAKEIDEALAGSIVEFKSDGTFTAIDSEGSFGGTYSITGDMILMSYLEDGTEEGAIFFYKDNKLWTSADAVLVLMGMMYPELEFQFDWFTLSGYYVKQ